MPILIADDFPPPFGGIQRYIKSLGDAFHVLGRDVVIIAPESPGSSAYDSALPYEVLRYGSTSKIIRCIEMSRELFSAHQARDGYAIASLWFPSGLVGLASRARSFDKIGILVHGSEISSTSTVRNLVMRNVLNRADAVIANSRFTRDLLAAAGIKKNIAISPCGVDDFAHRSKRAAVPTILSVGRLIKRKGFDNLIKALPDVVRALPKTICEIIGDGSERESLESQVAELGLRGCVRFLGSVSDSELHEAYGRAWCFAMPARREGKDVEGFGIVYLEAAVASLPVVGGKDSGATDAIADSDTGHLVDGRDTTAISTALLELLSNEDEARAMGARGRQRALAEFSWTANALRIERAIIGHQL